MSEREIFLAALDLPPAARAEYLDTACAADAAARARVQALLDSHEAAGSFLGTPAVAPHDPDASATRTFGDDGAAADGETSLGFLAPPTRPDSLGRIGHYEVLQVVGRGGFGSVYRAFDDELHRVVAVKVLAPQLAATSPARKRFLREARSAAAVRHENVVQVYEVGEQPLPYIVMEFIPGETLQQRLTRTGPVTAAEVVRVGRQVAEGLAAAHATDLIHRDIKPGNVLLEGGAQRVKITDFGLARAADDASISQSGIIAGTPMYMAPEQAKGETLDHRADLFSLGSVLYQMAAGRPPFRATGTLAVLKRVAEDTPRNIREITPETPQWLCDIIAKLHAKNSDDRFQTAREVADVLADCERQLHDHQEVRDATRIPKGPHRARGAGRRRGWAIVLACALFGVAFAALVWKGLLSERFFPTQATVRVIWRESPGSRVVIRMDWQQADADPIGVAGPGADTGVVRDETGAAGAQTLHVTRRTRSGHQVLRAFENGVEFYTLPVLVNRGQSYEYLIPDPPSLRPPPAERPPSPAPTPAPAPSNSAWVSLFNGKDLTGWEAHPTAPAGEDWRVEDGAIVGRSRGPTAFLFSTAEYANFHLRVEAKINGTGDAGVFIRAPFDVWTQPTQTKVFIPGGYEAQLCVRPDWQIHTGAILDSGRAVIGTAPLLSHRPDEWVVLEVVAQGNRLRTLVNGRTTADIVDEKRRYGRGRLALQAWGQNVTTAQFRKIEIKKLPPYSPLPPTLTNELGMEFVVVPRGRAWLGWGKDRPFVRPAEIPADFYIGKYEITQEEWEKVMGENPSYFARRGGGKGDVKDVPDADLKRFPVDGVSWDLCQQFVAKLNEREKTAGWVYRLPTQAEWEYACRGGPMADQAGGAFDYYFDAPTNAISPAQANILGDRGLDRTCRVGSYRPNALGVYDMHGNVWEWCQDVVPSNDGKTRVRRGGSWVHGPLSCPAEHAWPLEPHNGQYAAGLRLVRVPSGLPAPEAKKTSSEDTRDPDRRAAEYVQSLGGSVCVDDGNQTREIDFNAPLPKEVFTLTSFRLKEKPVTDAGLEAFRGCKNLKGIDLYGWGQATDAGLAVFKDCKDLQHLELHGTGVSDAGLAIFKDCKGLLTLNLWGCGQATDAGVAHFKDCKDLQSLQLGDTRVTDAGVAYFTGCKNLTHLYLRNVPMNDERLGQLKDLKNLVELELDGCTRLTDAGLAVLKELKSLRYLRLIGTAAGDATLAHLAGVDSLRGVILTSTKVTAKGVEGLAKAFPMCRIEWDGGVIEPK